MLHGFKLLQIKEFTLEQAEEVFHHSIIQTVTLSAHALPNAFLTKHPLVLFVLVLPALVRMKDQIGPIRYLLKRLVQHSCYHAQNRPVRGRIADEITAVQVKNGREVQFLSKQAELCHIRYPLLVRLLGMEVPVQQIWRDLTNLTFVGTILFHPDTANQAQLLHESLHSLMVQGVIAAAQFCCNTAVAVSTFVFMVYGCDLCFGTFIFICAIHPLQMVVESSTGQLSD